jgi:hypothetical protein
VRYGARVISGRFVGAAAVAVCLAVAGCGSSTSSSTTPSHPDFKTGFAAGRKEFRKLGTDIAQDVTGAAAKTDAELATEFGGLATRADQQASQLGALQVPAKYRQRMTSLVSGFHLIETDLATIATAAKTHDAASAAKVTRALLTDAAKIKAADTSLSKDLGLASTSAPTSSPSAGTSSSSTG